MLEGIFPAVITPLTEDLELHIPSFEKLIERLYRSGVHGLYVGGQTGEGFQLPRSVRQKTVEVAVASKPETGAVIAHVGAADIQDALQLVKHACRAGVDAVSSLPPGPGFSFAEIRAYYQALAAASDVPVLLYYYGDFSAAITSLEQILELCSIPNVVGLKFTDFDLYRLSWVHRAGYTVFNGRDEVLVAGLLMGAQGGIGSFYNLVPGKFVALYEHARAGRWQLARQLQDEINDLVRLVLRFPLIAAIKSLLSWSGIDCGPPAPPRRRLTPNEESELRQLVDGRHTLNFPT
ncbi:MAG: dihydrodipicolinate synthase family protein [Bryobacteraceae bacterium]|nr:dihydrodipicolinate synthase family protein [Bryobacteraceae bacterium]MDW8377519.1 dihydrodipicolinate synthase family protein [Bryobacterales bacterium]